MGEFRTELLPLRPTWNIPPRGEIRFSMLSSRSKHGLCGTRNWQFPAPGPRARCTVAVVDVGADAAPLLRDIASWRNTVQFRTTRRLAPDQGCRGACPVADGRVSTRTHKAKCRDATLRKAVVEWTPEGRVVEATITTRLRTADGGTTRQRAAAEARAAPKARMLARIVERCTGRFARVCVECSWSSNFGKAGGRVDPLVSVQGPTESSGRP